VLGHAPTVPLAAKVPPERRPSIIEWALLGLGMMSFSGLGLFLFKILPEQPSLLIEGSGATLLRAPVFCGAALLLVLGCLSAGLATRAATGSDRATFIMALGDAVAFALALMVYTSLSPGV